MNFEQCNDPYRIKSLMFSRFQIHFCRKYHLILIHRHQENNPNEYKNIIIDDKRKFGIVINLNCNLS